MSNIYAIIDNLLKLEGGYVDDPDDRGGATNLGITQATLSAYIGHTATKSDVKHLTKDLAARIYKTEYYLKPKIYKLPAEVQPNIFDISVNSGPKKAIKILQLTLEALGHDVGLIDGVLGPRTIMWTEKALKDLDLGFVHMLVDRRIDFYNDIVKNNPSQKKFLKGWLTRAESFRPDSRRA